MTLTARRAAGLSALATALAAAVLNPTALSPTATAAPVAPTTLSTTVETAGQSATAVPQLIAAAPSGESARLQAPGSVVGSDRLVTLRTSVLPDRAAQQRIGFDLGDGVAASGRITNVEHAAGYTAWTGTLDGVVGFFTVVRAGATYRATVTAPQGVYAITQAPGTRGARYWLTEVEPYSGSSAYDALTGPGDAASTGTAKAAPSGPTPTRKGRKSKITVLFAYTKAAKKEAGGKAGMKAAVALAAADTNTSLRNSGIKAKIKVRGIVPTQGKEAKNVFTDVERLLKPRDGTFDSAQRVRTKRKADIVHLLTAGAPNGICGAGYLPRTFREADRILGASASYLSCLPFLVATHEIGHNLGADHVRYRGVSHDSRLPYAAGYADPANGFISVMSYYDPCNDVGVFTCVRIPYFSSKKNTYNGLSLGSKRVDNTRAIKQFAPIIQRYFR